jgi:hypothetical protein
MKFFSNDAKENESEYDREHSDVVTSEPVAVPQQRAGSPWSDTPVSGSDDTDRTSSTYGEAGSPDDELAEQELRDGTDEDAIRRDDVHESDTTTYGPDGTVTPASDHDAEVDVPLDTDRDTDATLKDEGTFDSPAAVDPATGDELDDDRTDDDGPASRRDEVDEPVAVTDVDDDTARDRAEAHAEAEETVDEARADEQRAELNGAPVAVDPEPVPALDSESSADDSFSIADSSTDGSFATADTATDADAVPAVAVPVQTAATPGSGPEPALDRLFTDGDSFADRFRDIQLRFVDSPKEAVADAATLVGEAVDKLTAALQSQKDAVGGDSDDTEQLRVQLRSYRDLLNRLSAL